MDLPAQLDLLSEDVADPTNASLLNRLCIALRTKQRIIAVVGAGISVSAGIPDFRSPSGLFQKTSKYKISGKDLFDENIYNDPAHTTSFHDMIQSLNDKAKSAQPTPFHHMLASLASCGRLLRLYTQNIDGLEVQLPFLRSPIPLPEESPWPVTIQLHGSLEYMRCENCSNVSLLEADLFKGPKSPPCRKCRKDELARVAQGKRKHAIGQLRPRIVLYGGTNHDKKAIALVTKADLLAAPDALLVVGTTLKISGVKNLVSDLAGAVSKEANHEIIWVNNKDLVPKIVGMEGKWTLSVKGDCDSIAKAVALPKVIEESSLALIRRLARNIDKTNWARERRLADNLERNALVQQGQLLD